MSSIKERKRAVIDAGVLKEVVASLFTPVYQENENQVKVLCPFHDDEKPSLSVNLSDKGFFCMVCEEKGNLFDLYAKVKGCDFITALTELEVFAGIESKGKAVFKKSFESKPKITATFVYRDTDGSPLTWKFRMEPTNDTEQPAKFFFCCHGAKEGSKRKKGRHPKDVPYNLHLLHRLKKEDKNKKYPVFILEGEAKADILTAWGHCATSFDSGAKSIRIKWKDEWSKYFRKRVVYVVPDNDKSGFSFQEDIAVKLKGISRDVRFLELPDLPPKGDIIDWIKAEKIKDLSRGDDQLAELFKGFILSAKSIELKIDPLTMPPVEKVAEKSKTKKVSAFKKVWSVVKDCKLYRSEGRKEYVLIDGVLCCISLKEGRLVDRISQEVYVKYGEPPSNATMGKAVRVLRHRAFTDGESIRLYNRCGEDAGKIYYDLSTGDSVEVDIDGWRVVDSPVFMERLPHHLPHTNPSTKGDIYKVFDFLNVKDDQKVLFLGALVSFFYPSILSPLFHINGSPNSGKTTFVKMLKMIVDPTSISVHTPPRKLDDLNLMLCRYRLLGLDNMTSITPKNADHFSSILTGGKMEKRELHTDSDMVELSPDGIIVMSGIGIPYTQPDLLQRTVGISLAPLSPDQSKDEKTLLAEFKKVIPVIMGGVFDVLSKALPIHANLPSMGWFRMGAFHKIGFASSQVLGGNGEVFTEQYGRTFKTQTDVLLDTDTLFSSIVSIMSGGDWAKLRGGCKEVLKTLSLVANPQGTEAGVYELERDPTFPTPRGLINKLERLRPALLEHGVDFYIGRVSNGANRIGNARLLFHPKGEDPQDEKDF